MGIEELIYKRLADCDELTSLLETYSGLPAVFYQTSPMDKDKGWGQNTQYPRIVFDLDRRADTKRQNQGTLIVFVFYDRSGTRPELIEPIIRKRLENVLMKPDNGFPYCFAWAMTDSFEMTEAAGYQRKVAGIEIRFDILEFPMQETTDPDPVAAMNLFIRDLYPDSCVVGLSSMENFTELSAESPAFYCRFVRAEQEDVTNTVVWLNATLAVHVICPDQESRIKYAAGLANTTATCAEIIMLDDSPMRPVRLSLDNTSDYLRNGQVNMVMHYGLLRWMPQPHKITNVYIDIGNQEG